MNALASAVLAGVPGEFTIGSADIDARAKGVEVAGRGSVIRGFRVLSGSGDLVYVDERTGVESEPITLTAGDEITPERGLSIRSINGTSNGNPSAGLRLRAVWE